jgi:hypothetical protein
MISQGHPEWLGHWGWEQLGGESVEELILVMVDCAVFLSQGVLDAWGTRASVRSFFCF